DPRLITGTALYLDDLKVPGMQHACIVRSPYGAAKIRGVNVKPAKDLPGVTAVFTGEDVKNLGGVPCAASLPGLRVPFHHLLAQDRVYFVGHPVAVVVASDRYIARAAEKSLTLHSSTQIAHLMRTLVAGILGMPENLLRVITPDVGCGFGSKLNVYAEEALMAFIAMRINKPVKWVESRRENFQCTIHGRGHVDHYELAAKRDGTVLGLKLKLIQDLGAYHQLLTPAIPTLSVLMMPGLYKFKSISADIVGVFTNCVPTDAYRGAGRPEATHGIERMVDILAAELKMDPAAIRLKNFVGKDEFPYATTTGLSYDSGNYAQPLHNAMAQVDYTALRAEQAKARKEGK